MTSARKGNILFLIMMVMQFPLMQFLSVLYLFPVSDEFMMVLSQVFMFIVPGVIFIKINNGSIREFIKLKPLGIKNVILIIILTFLLMPVTSLLSAITSMFFSNTAAEMFDQNATMSTLNMIISIAVTPAICEEFFFRGAIFGYYRNVNVKKACIVVGLLFGVMHMDLQQFLYASFMGVIFCFFVYKTGSILASVLSHFILNGSQVLIVKLYEMLPPDEIAAVESITYTDFELLLYCIIDVIYVLPFLALFMWLFIRANKPSYSQGDVVGEYVLDYNPLPKHGENVLSIEIVISLVIYLLFVILYPLIIILFSP